MSTEVELKIKFHSEADWAAVREQLGGEAHPPASQENHFFDTRAMALSAGKFTCRLRDEGGAFTLTLKGPTQTSKRGLLSHRAEEEVVLSSDDARQLLDGSQPPLAMMERQPGMDEPRRALIERQKNATSGKPLVHIGSFHNVRTRVVAPLSIGDREICLTFEFDETAFPGGVEYELELELPEGVDPAEATLALRKLCDDAGVVGESASSKAKRFFAALGG